MMAEKKKFQPGVAVVGKPDGIVGFAAEEAVEDMEFTEEETKNQLRLREEDFLQGLVEAAGYSVEERQLIEIARNQKLLFAFHIRPLSEDEFNQCRKKHTKYVRNRQLGTKMAGETDAVKYRDEIIYLATVEEDREKLWDNKKAWTALRNMGLQVLNGLDVIEYSLKAGEKDRVVDAVEQLSGYGDNLEETIKN